MIVDLPRPCIGGSYTSQHSECRQGRSSCGEVLDKNVTKYISAQTARVSINQTGLNAGSRANIIVTVELWYAGVDDGKVETKCNTTRQTKSKSNRNIWYMKWETAYVHSN